LYYDLRADPRATVIVPDATRKASAAAVRGRRQRARIWQEGLNALTRVAHEHRVVAV
jgi:hypothetical protein